MENAGTLIVEQLKIGNENVYRCIYDHYYALLCYVTNGYLKDQFLSETIVGDTIFHLWEIRETLDTPVSIRSYLLRAVRSRCISYLNLERERREIAFSALMPDEITDDKIILSGPHPLGILLERELENEICKAIDKSPDECRRVFVRNRFEGKSYEEISGGLGMSINTVKYHIKNAPASLHAHLSGYLISLLLFFFK